MIIFLIIVNLLLLAAVIFLFFKQEEMKKHPMGTMEDIELIEFQQNLKILINELSKTAEQSVDDVNKSKSDFEAVKHEGEKLISELRYLIDRNKRQRSAEYKAEIGSVVREPEKKVEIQREPVQPDFKPEPVQNQEPVINKVSQETKKESKFIINDKETFEEEPDKYSRIKKLSDNGMSIEEISSITGVTKGEIELIINIKKR